MNVSVNCPSMKPVAAEAPTGSHQVLATKNYVLVRVISQINTINARPIPQPSGHETISPRPLPRPTTQAPVGGECNTATREECKEILRKKLSKGLRHTLTRVLC
jgi:hypothetical protein